MRKLVIILLMFLLCGCGTVKYVPVETRADSVYVERVIPRIDTLKIEVPGETVMVEVQDTSSYLETSVAESWARVDSSGRLYHKLGNKKVSLEKEVVYLDREVEKKVEVEKEVPVEVEKIVEVVPGYYRWVSGLFWVLVLGIVGFVIFKLRFARIS